MDMEGSHLFNGGEQLAPEGRKPPGETLGFLTGGIPLSFAGVAGEGGYSTKSYIRHRTNLTKGARNLAKLRKVPRNERYSTVHM